MRNGFLFLIAAAFVLTLGVAVLDSAAGSAAAAVLGVGDDPQAPPQPQAVSPADPKTAPPNVGCCVCPRCGAVCPGPGWRHKGQLGQPQLAPGCELKPGRECGRNPRPGRYGREGDRRHCGPGSCGSEGCCHSHGMGFGRGASCAHGAPHECAQRAFRGCVRGAPRGLGEWGPRAMGRVDLPGRGMRGGFAAEMMLRRAEDLKLTEDQIGKLEGLANDAKKKLVDLNAEIEKSEIEIQALLSSENEDLTQIKRHLDTVSKARSEIQEVRITHLFEARKVLTAEQKKMLKEECPRLGRIVD